MNDMNTTETRLQQLLRDLPFGRDSHYGKIVRKAADRLDALEARVKELEALRTADFLYTDRQSARMDRAMARIAELEEALRDAKGWLIVMVAEFQEPKGEEHIATTIERIDKALEPSNG